MSQELINRVFTVDRRVRFVALFDAEGLLKGMRMRTGVASLTPRAVDETMIPALVQTGLRLRPYVGTFTRALLEYEKVKLIFAAMGSEVLFVSLEPDAPRSVIDQIAQRLEPAKRPVRRRARVARRQR